MSKTSLHTFGNVFGFFGFWKFFWFFCNFSKTRPSVEHWAKNFFRKNRPKTFLKHVWILLRMILGLFGFLMFFEDSTLHGTLGKIFFQKNCPKTCSKHVWTLLRMILGLLGFLKFLEDSTLHGTLVKSLLEKIAPKHVWTLENVFGHFGTLKLFWFFSSISFKYLPQNSSPENWTQIFWVRKTELIFLSPENLKSPAWNTG